MNTCQHCQAAKEDLSRRTFLKQALGATGAALALSFFPAEFLRRTAAAATNAGKTLVVVFQRGGNDGLNTIVPYIDPQYYVVRPSAADNSRFKHSAIARRQNLSSMAKWSLPKKPEQGTRFCGLRKTAGLLTNHQARAPCESQMSSESGPSSGSFLHIRACLIWIPSPITIQLAPALPCIQSRASGKSRISVVRLITPS